MIEVLKERIKNRETRVAVIGLGYVGLPLAVEFGKEGFPVIGVDVDLTKVEKLRKGISYIPDVPSDDLADLVSRGLLRATTDYAALSESDAALICVPTPLAKTRDPDISYIASAAEELRKYLKPGHIVSLESTTYPGTTEEFLQPILEKSGLKAGQDFFLAFSPERINPGDKVYTVRNTPKVVGGVDPKSTEIVGFLYEQIVEQVVRVSSAKVAEMTKLLENTFRSVNIALVNEMAIACDILGIDIWEVIEAAATKPFGFMKFTPGPGIGGHCIPIDPHYLSWKLRTLNYNARFIELASEINTQMPRYVVSRVQDALNEVQKSLKGSKILVLGAAYKKDIDDTRESPALDIMELLDQKGAEVYYNDPFVPEIQINGKRRTSVELTDALLSSVDCVVIATDHSVYDWGWIVERAKLVVDTRNATRAHRERARNIVPL